MQITNILNLPQPFVDAATSDYEYTPKRYSVTSLQKGIREVILTRRHSKDIQTDVADRIWAIFGSAVHSILENSEESNTQIKESWISTEMPNGYTLSGIFDLYDGATKTVTDYKTTSIYKVRYDEMDDYRFQLLGYCWLLNQNGFEANRGEVVVILKDHSKSKARVESNYPPYPVYIKSWDFTEQDLDDFGAWAQYRFEEIEKAEQLPDEELPLCTPEERWATPEKWAVKKKGNKKAQRLFDNEQDAIEYAARQSEIGKATYEIEYRPGEDKKCIGYCSACEFCDYYKSLKEAS